MTSPSPHHRHADLARDLMPSLRDIAEEAGRMAMAHFRSGLETSAQSWSKSGGSPVTEADIAVDTFLKERLMRALPEAGWLSEETADDPDRLTRDLVWIVDPIDGTRAFMAGSHDWSIAIALASGGRPVAGIVYAPAHETLFEAHMGGGARRDGHPIAVSPRTDMPEVTVTGPKPQVDRMEAGAGAFKRVPRIPSLALRIARVAEGSVDVGLVSARPNDWDIAAADLILTEAGGLMTDLACAAPAYNQPEPCHGELVAASRELHPHVIEAMTGRQKRAARLR